MNITIEIRAKPEKFNELYQTLQALLPTMRAEHGYRKSRIYRDVEMGSLFLAINWELRRTLRTINRSTSGRRFSGLSICWQIGDSQGGRGFPRKGSNS